jgi:hypothetical protein
MNAQTMPDTRGLVPAIHVLLRGQDVDARHKAGHDDSCVVLRIAPE